MLRPSYLSTRQVLEEILDHRVLLLDGSMGALIYSKSLEEADYRGQALRDHPRALKNCTEALVLAQPRLIEELHEAYLEAGSDLIETCTFNATTIGLVEFGLQDRVFEINKRAAELAREAAERWTRRTPDRPRFVAGSIGPTNKSLYIEPGAPPGSRSASFDDFVTAYTAQIDGLVAGGADLLVVETGNDILVVKACLFALDRYFAEKGIHLPVIVSGTLYHPGGRTLFSQTPEAFYVSVSHFDALGVGFNCGVGVDLLREPIESLAKISTRPTVCYPNAGLPDGMGGFRGIGRDATAAMLGEFARNGWVNIVGGCCGTTPEWIAAIDREITGVVPRRTPDLPPWSYYSGNEVLVVRPETNFVMVGEWCNITGSLKFKRLIKEGNYEAAVAATRGTDRLLLLDFTSYYNVHDPDHWCDRCQEMRRTWEDPRVQEWVRQYGVVTIVDGNVDDELARDYAIEMLPTVVVVRDEREIGRRAGYQDADAFLAWLAELVAELPGTPGDTDELPSPGEVTAEYARDVHRRARDLLGRGAGAEALPLFLWLWGLPHHAVEDWSRKSRSLLIHDTRRLRGSGGAARELFELLERRVHETMASEDPPASTWKLCADLAAALAEVPRLLAWARDSGVPARCARWRTRCAPPSSRSRPVASPKIPSPRPIG